MDQFVHDGHLQVFQHLKQRESVVVRRPHEGRGARCGGVPVDMAQGPGLPAPGSEMHTSFSET